MELTGNEVRWINSRKEQLDRDSTAAAAAAPLRENGAGDVMVRVEFDVDAWFVADNDVVLTTYELLRNKSTIFRKVRNCCAVR